LKCEMCLEGKGVSFQTHCNQPAQIRVTACFPKKITLLSLMTIFHYFWHITIMQSVAKVSPF